ncbi:MAG: lipid-A-disaccharide synthase [candidate division KSB1 bacterium]|nr:lipid-A-disaccharide synthase [candidate division KSB1 bacterium]
MSGRKLLVIAGEASGDLHGGKLIEALLAADPSLKIAGIGGDRMQAAGMTLIRHIRETCFMGFAEVVRHLGKIRRTFAEVMHYAREEQPELAVLIDYPGFNLRLGKRLKALGTPVFYYIAPQVWAWHESRAQKMAAFVDRMAVIFPFEVDFFRRYGIDARFVGHPLMDGLQITLSRQEFFRWYDLDENAPLLAVFPGSRMQEIDRLLPMLLKTAEQLKSQYPKLQVAVSVAETISKQKMEARVKGFPVRLVPGCAYELMAYADAAVVKSGTSTLEAACFETPFCLVYKVSPLSFAIGKRVVKIPHIGLVNIVAGREIVKEFVQGDAVPDRILPEIERLLFDAAYRQEIKSSLAGVKGLLGTPGASVRTASLILEMLQEKRYAY